MMAGLAARWRGHPNIAGSSRRLDRNRMNFFDDDDGDDVVVDAYPDGPRPCIGACLHQKLMGLIDEGIKESDAVVYMTITFKTV